MRNGRGFTLLEVMIALGILAVTLTALLQSQAGSLRGAARVGNVSIGTLLARSKMVDLEYKLVDEGFTEGDKEESGDFTEEGFADFSWHATIREVKLDLSGLGSLCGAMGKEKEAAADCEALVGGLGGAMTGFVDEIQRGLRAVELTVSWKEGQYQDQVNVRCLVTRDGLGLS
jgi:general secretion pathway protein I